jgi:transposase
MAICSPRRPGESEHTFPFSVRPTRDHQPMDKDVLDTLLGRGLSLERIAERFGKHPSTIGYWVRKHGLSAANSERHAARGGIPRGSLQELIDAGGTLRSISEDLEVSVGTVRHWLDRYQLRTHAAIGRHPAVRDVGPRPETIDRTCKRHGLTRYVLRTDGAYRCLRCTAESVARRRRAVRMSVVSEAGGRCAECGYDAYLGALQFHHIDPGEKEFALSSQGLTRSLERVRREAEKCVLLCANCHAEVEGGVRTLSLQFVDALKTPPEATDYPV